MSPLQTLKDDLFSVAAATPLQSLVHVDVNSANLGPGHYVHGSQRCIMAMLTELQATPITSKESLARYFTGLPLDQALQHPDYQGPKWIVRWFDGDIVERYGGVRMTWDERKALVLECIRTEIARRTATPTDVLAAGTAEAQLAEPATAI